ncbi:nucleoside 2-deoxyribosyltransferase [Peribacillus muralis]|uniref:nucleoside 2-deoxyribosyltransferase n=1 Tax=Peribacillus muralis TaxID=264697 RepID=UPI00366E4CBB
MAKIYLASPFFSPEQLQLVETAEQILRKQGHNVFSPRENQVDGLEYGTIPWRTAVFGNDIKHVQWADYVVAIVAEGNYSDSGTAMEIGYAYGIAKPVIVINPTKNTVNLMIADALHAYLGSWTDLLNYDFETMPVKPYVGGVI